MKKKYFHVIPNRPTKWMPMIGLIKRFTLKILLEAICENYLD